MVLATSLSAMVVVGGMAVGIEGSWLVVMVDDQ